ncbi:MAG: cytochrome c maturation protein CcmE, partial [Candidatus Zixiibacteriota bacterium]
MKGKKKRFIILGSLVILVVAYLVYSGMRESMLYYYTVSELKTNANQLYGQGVRVSGQVVEGS